MIITFQSEYALIIKRTSTGEYRNLKADEQQSIMSEAARTAFCRTFQCQRSNGRSRRGKDVDRKVGDGLFDGGCAADDAMEDLAVAQGLAAREEAASDAVAVAHGVIRDDGLAVLGVLLVGADLAAKRAAELGVVVDEGAGVVFAEVARVLADLDLEGGEILAEGRELRVLRHGEEVSQGLNPRVQPELFGRADTAERVARSVGDGELVADVLKVFLMEVEGVAVFFELLAVDTLDHALKDKVVGPADERLVGEGLAVVEAVLDAGVPELDVEAHRPAVLDKLGAGQRLTDVGREIEALGRLGHALDHKLAVEIGPLEHLVRKMREAGGDYVWAEVVLDGALDGVALEVGEVEVHVCPNNSLTVDGDASLDALDHGGVPSNERGGEAGALEDARVDDLAALVGQKIELQPVSGRGFLAPQLVDNVEQGEHRGTAGVQIILCISQVAAGDKSNLVDRDGDFEDKGSNGLSVDGLANGNRVA